MADEFDNEEDDLKIIEKIRLNEVRSLKRILGAGLITGLTVFGGQAYFSIQSLVKIGEVLNQVNVNTIGLGVLQKDVGHIRDVQNSRTEIIDQSRAYFRKHPADR